MLDGEVIQLASHALMLTLILSMPPILAATAVGLMVSLVQALTQIQEQTLPFAFKLIAVMISIFATARWLGIELYNFSMAVMTKIGSI